MIQYTPTLALIRGAHRVYPTLLRGYPSLEEGQKVVTVTPSDEKTGKVDVMI